MAIFRTYDKQGNVLFDSQKIGYCLIKAGHLTWLNTNEQAGAGTLNALLRKTLSHIYYIDVQATTCPLVFVHYDDIIRPSGYGLSAGVDNYNTIIMQSMSLINPTTYRIFFVSSHYIHPINLEKFQVYIFDKIGQKETIAGLNTYDRQGNLTFSTKHPLLPIVDNIPRPKATSLINGYQQREFLKSFGNIGAELSDILKRDGIIADNQSIANDDVTRMYSEYATQIYHIGGRHATDYPHPKTLEYFTNTNFGEWWYQIDFVGDVVFKFYDKDRKYATLHTFESSRLYLETFVWGGYDGANAKITSAGLNGGVYSAFGLYTALKVPNINEAHSIRFRQHPDDTGKFFSDLVLADVSHLPFPYN